MINLLPPQARKAVTREYWLRVVTVWALLLAVGCIACGLLLMPSYVLLQAHLAAVTTEAGALENAGGDAFEAEARIKEANLLAEELADNSATVTLSGIIMSIDQARKSASITLNAYAVERTTEGLETVHVQGVARTREALLAFQEALEAEPLFETATVPIANLVRGTNLPFAMTITLADTTHE